MNSLYRAVPAAAFLFILLSSTASAQHPSLQAGDWLRVDFRARFQGDVRRSEAPMADEDPGLDIARRRVGIEGRIGQRFDYQVEYELGGAGEWKDVYLDYRRQRSLRGTG